MTEEAAPPNDIPAKPAAAGVIPPVAAPARPPPATPPTTAPAGKPEVAPAQPAEAGRSAAKALTLLGLALLAAGFVWLAMQNQELTTRLAAAQREQESRAGVQDGLIRTLQQRLAAIEARPAGAAPDLRPLEARIAALEQRPAAGPAADLSPVEGRIAALEQRPAADPRVAALAGRVDRLAKLPAALAALAAQEVALKNEFPAVARAAEAVSIVDDAGKPLAERMLLRVQSLVTIRSGDAVLTGPPAAPLLARARVHLAADDIAGALAALDGLDPAAAQATAAWRAKAKALVDARAALAKAGE
jgi:hypothetical protein